MADFSSNLPVGLTGLNLSNVPTYPVNADSNGNMNVHGVTAGPVTPGTAATYAALMAGQYNAALPSLSTGQQSAIQIDASGRLIISPLTNASVVKAQLQDNSGNGITSTLINSKQRLDVDLAAEGVDGSSAPYDTLQIGGKDPNSDLQTLSTDTSGNLYVVGNIATATADSGNPVKIGMVYSGTTLPATTSGERVNAQANQFGELSIQYRNKYKNITSSGATVVKSGSGRLHGISFSQNSGITVTVYDNTAASGTVIALFQSQNMVFVGPLGCEFTTGLTINQSGSNNITVYYQ